MRYVLCLLDPGDCGLPEELRRQYETLPLKRGLEYAWRSFDHAAVLTAWDDPWGDPLVVQDGEWIAVGMARLDNRAEVARWTELDRAALAGLTDLALVLKVVASTGTKRIRDILGDFAFAAWHAASRLAIAGADALGVKKLLYTERQGRVAFATRAEALVLEERYEAQYLAEMIALCPVTPGLTAFEGVRRLPPGVLATLERGDLQERTYWVPEEFERVAFTQALEREAPAQLRALLAESVKQRVTDDGTTWAQLSGGLDSSSIVSFAHWLQERGEIERGLAGTVTFVDWQGTCADEREYVAAVVQRWGMRNEQIIEPPVWLDDEPPPQTDWPRAFLALYPRERRLSAMVRGAGGRVLLAGFGSDELFTGTAIFFADRVARGHLWSAARDIARWAALGRTSFWELAWGNVIVPLTPRRLRRPGSTEQGQLLPWITAEAARRFALRHRTYSDSGTYGPIGCRYHGEMAGAIRTFTTQLDTGVMGEQLDVRYPFLARRLVEFALRLPPELCARPRARKWVLREAMRGILPEPVRTRVGKGNPLDVLVHSLTTQSELLQPLVAHPVLAELGVVDAHALREAYVVAPHKGDRKRNLSPRVQCTLAVEAWLQIRSGRWPPGPSLQVQLK